MLLLSISALHLSPLQPSGTEANRNHNKGQNDVEVDFPRHRTFSKCRLAMEYRHYRTDKLTRPWLNLEHGRRVAFPPAYLLAGLPIALPRTAASGQPVVACGKNGKLRDLEAATSSGDG